VDFLKSYLVKLKTQSVEHQTITTEDRWQLVEAEFKGKEFKRKEVLALYKKNDILVSPKTVDRDLMKAIKFKQGVFRIE
jgi:hypothetical protein